MDQIFVDSLDALKAQIATLGVDALFRGQTTHYGETGNPSIRTSFDRRGCIPSQMLKWSRYASNVLDAFVSNVEDRQGFIQALLQHYGWRSFYLDFSSNAAVSAWFASHDYTSRTIIEMSEDFEERPVWLRKMMARYDFSDGEGHLYIIDKDSTRQSGLIDLAPLTVKGYSPRPAAQAAWLVGPLRNEPLPIDCYRAHIVAPRSVLRDYAAEAGLVTTDDLFPSVKEDPILHALLGLPWREIKGVRDDAFPIPAFQRALDIPEYQDSFVKIAWPRTAFFCGKTITDNMPSIDGDDVGGIVVRVPEIVLFGSADDTTPMRFPAIEALIRKSGTVAFEIDDLVQHATMGHTTLYQKGVGVIPRGDNLFEVCELLVEHPGLDMTRAGFNRGWFYRRDTDGVWKREAHELECDCGHAPTHRGHISALHIAEAWLQNPDDFGD